MSAPDDRMRWLLLGGGLMLLAAGMVLAFAGGDGVATASVMATGAALASVGYIGRALTSIEFRAFEATIERIGDRLEEVGTKAEDAVTHLEDLGAHYEAVRTLMRLGGKRDSRMSVILAEDEETARQGQLDAEAV